MHDAVWLSRIQFAVTVGFHFFFVSISLGLAWLIFTVETAAWRSGSDAWKQAGRFFGKMLGLSFAFGAASGIVMEFQFGTNWAAFSRYVGDIFGPPLAAETMFAFFLESIFIGVYIFGRDRVSPALHWFSSLMVAVGATISAFWIIAANSWMQTPAGYVIRNGRVELENFRAALFNFSTWPRFFHTVDGVMIAGAFFMAGISAYLLIKDRAVDVTRRTLKVAVIFGVITTCAELWPFGHIHAVQVAYTQPSKFATTEAVEHTQDKLPFIIMGIPVENPNKVKWPVFVQGALTWLVGSELKVRGMDSFAPEDLPPFAMTFVSFHTMVYIGLGMILLMVIAAVMLHRGTLYTNYRFLWLLLLCIGAPHAAIQLGWITAEVGRQPWIIYGLMRTSQAASETVPANHVLTSLLVYCFVYAVLGTAFIWLICRIVSKGPETAVESEAY